MFTYDTIVVFGVNFDFWGFYMFGDIIVFNVCLKNGFFKSFFQQSATGKMTTQT